MHDLVLEIAELKVGFTFANKFVVEHAFDSKIRDGHKETQTDVEICVSEEECRLMRKRYPGIDDNLNDLYSSCALTSDAFMSRDRCCFHSVAIEYQGKAYLFAAPSGVGKTTHYFLWKLAFGEEVQMINGDKPALLFREGKPIMVYPTPWRGKENMGQEINAPLAGIVLLKQAKENHIFRPEPRDIVGDIYQQIISTHKTKELIHKTAGICERLIKQVPIYILENNAEIASAILCRDALTGRIESNEI